MGDITEKLIFKGRRNKIRSKHEASLPKSEFDSPTDTSKWRNSRLY